MFISVNNFLSKNIFYYFCNLLLYYIKYKKKKFNTYNYYEYYNLLFFLEPNLVQSKQIKFIKIKKLIESVIYFYTNKLKST